MIPELQGRAQIQGAFILGNYLPLDALSVRATAAYSLRQLTRNYKGPAIQVRRSDNNNTQDIGFVNGVLDTTSLTTFVDGVSGFVSIWYDQSGNNNHAIQNTRAKQPHIVSAGALISTPNGLPAVYSPGSFGSAGQILQTANSIFNLPYTQNVVFAASTLNSVVNLIGTPAGGTNAGNCGIVIQATNQLQVFNASSSTRTSAISTDNVYTTTAMVGLSTVPGNSRLALNGTLGAVGNFNLANPAPANFTLFSGTGLQYNFNGIIQEACLFPSVLSISDRQSLERSQGAYYRITVA